MYVADEKPSFPCRQCLRDAEIGEELLLVSYDPFEIDSPYNTRLHTGLPPTPIASPGIPSLRAALNPADVPYLYYVLCSSNGAHRFSVSYDQFLSDKAECLG